MDARLLIRPVALLRRAWLRHCALKGLLFLNPLAGIAIGSLAVRVLAHYPVRWPIMVFPMTLSGCWRNDPWWIVGAVCPLQERNRRQGTPRNLTV